MGPSLPLSLFDLCLIPEHDSPPQRPNVVPTLGALNNLTPTGAHTPDQGLILVGGPSSHFQWDSPAITRQIRELVQDRPEMKWALTTSRRTPADFPGLLDGNTLDIHPVETTPPGWLEDRLSQAGEVWVTPDSVSMVYEALTAGCRVGLLDLPAKADSRVASGVMSLMAKGRVSVFPERTAKRGPLTVTAPLMEAGRCAELIRKKWFT
jgi:mitochondrial fission protein ELM1